MFFHVFFKKFVLAEKTMYSCEVIFNKGVNMKERLRALRGSLGLSQSELAKKIGCGLAAVQSWESGKITPKAEYGIKLCELYGVTLDYLYLGREAVTLNDTGAPQDILNQVVLDLAFIFKHDEEAFLHACKFISGMRYEVMLD